MTTRGRAPRLLAALLLVAVLLVVGARLATDWWWADAAGLGPSHRTRTLAGLGLALACAALMAATLGGNLLLARRLQRRAGILDELVADRLLLALAERRTPLLAALVAGCSLVAGLGGWLRRDDWLLWRHRVGSTAIDPTSRVPVEWFLVELPWWRFVLTQLGWALGLSLLVVGVLHLVWDAMRRVRTGVDLAGHPVLLRGPRRPVPAARAQLALVGAALCVVLSVRTWLEGRALEVSDNGLFTGLAHTDLAARVPAHQTMALVLLACAGTLLLAARRGWWRLPLVAAALAIASSLVLQVLYPVVLEQVQVRPHRAAMEAPLVKAHQAATREAFGLDRLQTTTASTVARAAGVPSGAPIGAGGLDPVLAAEVLQRRQASGSGVALASRLDLDHYAIGEGDIAVASSLRESDPALAAAPAGPDPVARPGRGWLPVAATAGAAATAAVERALAQPGTPTWYGERATGAALAAGASGIGLDDPLVRLALAVRQRDPGLVPSRAAQAGQRLLLVRQPRERVQAAAPWLTVDSDPYPVRVGGRLLWVVDGYTTSETHPQAQLVDWPVATASGSRRVNHARNSVKATVDATDGTVRLYAWDESDPLLASMRAALPGLVQDRDTVPPELRAQFRYPRDLFLVQARLVARYHVTDPAQWLAGADHWRLPEALGAEGRATEPQRRLLAWPGGPTRWSLVLPLLDQSRDQVTALLAADSDARTAGYGQLRLLTLPTVQRVPGPTAASRAAQSDTTVRSAVGRLAGGHPVAWGEPQLTPWGDQLAWLQPVHRRDDAAAAQPVAVVLNLGTQRAVGRDAASAAAQLRRLGVPVDAERQARARELLAKAEQAQRRAATLTSPAQRAERERQLALAAELTRQARDQLGG